MSEPHPECAKMHRGGYCICVTVDCMFCELRHPPSKMCKERALIILEVKDRGQISSDLSPIDKPR